MQDSLSRTPKVGVGQTSTNSIRKENEKVNTIEKNSSENVPNDEKKAKAIDKREEKEYDGIKNSRRAEDGREEDRADSREEGTTPIALRREKRGSVPVRLNDGRICELREIFENERRLEDGTDGREEGSTKTLHERERGGVYSRGIISYTDDAGRVRYLRETTGREELEKRIKNSLILAKKKNCVYLPS